MHIVEMVSIDNIIILLFWLYHIGKAINIVSSSKTASAAGGMLCFELFTHNFSVFSFRIVNPTREMANNNSIEVKKSSSFPL